MKRLVDLALLIPALPFALPLALLVALAVRLTSQGPALYWSKRVGKDETIFLMPKFRTMRTDTPAVATHLLPDPDQWLTPVGSFLRRTSLDEIPQFWSLIKGDMTLVGPRPALFNQDDLMALRRETGVSAMRPGLTGWAQVNGRDDLPIPAKVEFEREYLSRQSLAMDLRIILMTIGKVLRPSGVSH